MHLVLATAFAEMRGLLLEYARPMKPSAQKGTKSLKICKSITTGVAQDLFIDSARYRGKGEGTALLCHCVQHGVIQLSLCILQNPMLIPWKFDMLELYRAYTGVILG